MKAILNNQASQAASDVVNAVKALLDAAGDSKQPIPSDDLGFLCDRIQSARTGFSFVQEERAPQAVNRLGSVLLGPVFTSQAYPWPVDEDGNPMAPLCQLNSAQLPIPVEGIEGLVQVWLSQEDSGHAPPLIRLVPAAEADPALMTPVIQHDEDFDVLLPEAAEWLRDFHSEPKPSKNEFITAAAKKLGHNNAEELADADWDEWIRQAEAYGDQYGDDVVPCIQIVRFKDASVYCDITYDQKDAMASLEKLLKKLKNKVEPSDEALVPLLGQACSAYKAWLRHMGDQNYPCFLGTFQEIQYRALDMDAPFICFESIGLREWGDGGNAQVFYSQEKGFSFEWSCS